MRCPPIDAMALRIGGNYHRRVVKDIILLASGMALVALGSSLLGHEPIRISRDGGYMSLAAALLFLGIVLIVVAIADWRYRSRNPGKS